MASPISVKLPEIKACEAIIAAKVAIAMATGKIAGGTGVITMGAGGLDEQQQKRRCRWV